MKKASAFLFTGLLAALLPQAAFSLSTESYFSPSASGKKMEVASGSAIARFRAGVSTAAAAAELAAAGFVVERPIGDTGFVLVRLPANMAVVSGLAALGGQGALAEVYPNRVFRPTRVPDDPLITLQYHLGRIAAFGAWEYETGFSSQVTVAVIDTGVDGAHPELVVKSTGTSKYINPDTIVVTDNQPPTPACNHATRAAGVAVAAADNLTGVAGISWGAKLLSLKIFKDSDCNAQCACATTEAAIATAIDEARPLHNTPVYGKIVINMSLGSDGGSCSPALQSSVNSAVSAGLLLFAATGNLSRVYMDSPANCTGVIAVGATDASDTLAYFSNSDPAMATKGVTAPGVEVYTTDMGGGYASATGTSFSSPMTAGLAALLWSANPSATAAQIKNFIFDSADDLGPAGPDKEYGRGRINALKAMRLAKGETRAFRGENKAVAYPNPFRPAAHSMVTFSVPADVAGTNAEVKVFTSEGELVSKPTGLSWDGKNSAGAPAASGVYLFRVKTDKAAATGKFVLMRP